MAIAVVGTGWTRTGSSADSASAEDLAGAAELLVEKSIGSSCGGGGNCGRCWPDVGGGGSIINTASIAGLSGDAGPLAYSAAKAAVINLSKGAAVELAQDHIRVNAICPGFIATPLAALGGSVAELSAQFATAQPWPEAGNGDHIAGVALFLASDDARFVTGESILVDGGLTASGPELSRKFPRTAGRQSRYAGITRGSTGEPPALRKLDT